MLASLPLHSADDADDAEMMMMMRRMRMVVMFFSVAINRFSESQSHSAVQWLVWCCVSGHCVSRQRCF